MNALLLAAGVLAGLLAIGHATGGHKFVFRPMTDAEFDPLARRTMVFVWHLSTLILFMTAAGLVYAAITPGGRDLVLYLVAQSAGLSLIHLATAATSGIDGWAKKMPQWVVFAVIAGLTAAGM